MKILLLLVFVLLASPAAAEPISLIIGAIGSAGSWLFGGTVLANIVLGGLAAAAKFALNSIFVQKPKAQASKTETQYGENLAREIGMGTFGTMGHHIYRNAFGDGNRMVQDVFKVSDFRTTGLDRVMLDGKWKAISSVEGTYGRRVLDVHEGGEIWVRFYNGTMTQAADPQLMAHANPSGRWTAAHRGAGISYVVVTSRMDQDNLTAPPSLLFEVRGAPLYDPRKDSTVGGSGAQRRNNQDTWDYSDNPAVMMFNLEFGIYNGQELMVGRGASVSRLPLSEWFTAMNICDESMPDGSKRYTAALIASSGDAVTHDSNMTPLREACAASWVEAVMGEYPIIGANQAVVATITDNDINIEKPFSLSLSRPRSELVNTIAGTYVSPDAFYETTPLATRIDQDALAQDRERFASKVDYTAVTDPRVGDRLADIAIRASRYQASASFCVHPKFLEVKVGQWISWQSDRYKFTKTFQVLTKSLGALGGDGTRDVTLSLQEVGNGIFDATAYTTHPPVPTPSGDPAYLSEVANPQYFANIVVGSTGDEHPGIRITWDEINDLTVTGIDLQYWPDTDATQIFNHSVRRDVSTVQLTDGLTSQTEWWVRTRLRVASGTRPVAWSVPVRVLTLDTTSDQSPVDYDGLDQDMQGLLNWVTGQTRELIRQGQEQAILAADNHNSIYSNMQALSRRLSSTFGSAKAQWREDIYTATGPHSAIGQQLVQLNVSLGAKADASIVNMLQARVDGVDEDITAITNALLQVNAAVGGDVSEGTLRMEAVAGSGGTSMRISAFARVGAGEAWRRAGWFINVTKDYGQFMVYADQFAVVDPSDPDNTTFPFVVRDGQVYIERARIGQVNFDQLTSNNGKLVITGFGDRAEIRMYT